MTRDEVIAKWEALNPRERDAWIAVEIFGLDVTWYSPNRPDSVPLYDDGERDVPRYTKSVSAAWSVLTRMSADYYVKVERIAESVNVTGNYVAECGGHIGWGTAPEAICLAALIAKLAEGDD